MEHSYVIGTYLNNGPVSRLDRDQEVTLVARARRGEPDTVDRLIRAHMPFVLRVAKEFRGRGVPFEDLVHEGCLGLLKAIRRFDPENGARFMTYASFWVRKAILEALGEQPRVVRVPRYQRLKGRGILKEFRLDDPIAQGSARTFGESLPDTRTQHPASALIARETTSRLRGHLRALPARDGAVIAARYGLNGGPAMTLMEVGDRLSLSRERVRQIESAALSRLRRAMAR